MSGIYESLKYVNNQKNAHLQLIQRLRKIISHAPRMQITPNIDESCFSITTDSFMSTLFSR